MTDPNTLSHEPRPGPNGAQFLRQQAQQAMQAQQTQQAATPEPDGFDAGDVWVFPYNLNPYVDAKGHVPPPTQARIDRFQRNMAKFMLELQKRADDAERAQEKASGASLAGAVEGEEDSSAGFDFEAAMREVDEAQALYAEAMEKVKDALADLCAGHPTRKQLDKLPEYVLKRFANALGRKLNPEA